MCGLGERVHFKTTSEKSRKNELDTEWDTGFDLGTSPRTTEYLVGNEAGIISCSTFRRMPDENTYDKACLEVVLELLADEDEQVQIAAVQCVGALAPKEDKAVLEKLRPCLQAIRVPLVRRSVAGVHWKAVKKSRFF